MADRYPLVIDTTNGNSIKELPEDDNLNLRTNDIVNVQNINALGIIDAAEIRVNGESITNSDIVFEGITGNSPDNSTVVSGWMEVTINGNTLYIPLYE